TLAGHLCDDCVPSKAQLSISGLEPGACSLKPASSGGRHHILLDLPPRIRDDQENGLLTELPRNVSSDAFGSLEEACAAPAHGSRDDFDDQTVLAPPAPDTATSEVGRILEDATDEPLHARDKSLRIKSGGKALVSPASPG